MKTSYLLLPVCLLLTACGSKTSEDSTDNADSVALVNELAGATIVREIDLDGNGSPEKIIKKEDGYFLAYLDSEGKYETYTITYFGKEGKDDAYGETKVLLNYTREGNKTIVESTVKSGKDSTLANGFFSWNGIELLVEIKKAKRAALDTLHSAMQLWESFKRVNREECLAELEKSHFLWDGPSAGCDFTESASGFSTKYFTMGGYRQYEYSAEFIKKGELVLIKKSLEIGEAESWVDVNTIAAFRQRYWHLYELNGTADTVLLFPNRNILTFTKTSRFGSGETNWSGSSNQGFNFGRQWNIYLLPPEVTRISPIGVFGKDWLGGASDLPKGEIFTDSIGLSYHFDQTPIALTVTEFKRKKNGDKADRVNETKVIEYQWDEKQNRFIVK